MSIDGKVVIVTGASSGIGKATAELFGKNGAKVALAARSADKLEEISTSLADSFVVPVDQLNQMKFVGWCRRRTTIMAAWMFSSTMQVGVYVRPLSISIWITLLILCL
jgi:NAD(P)-dependent dehydrogenase (short-subunit alcohol dehydrogenase family)